MEGIDRATVIRELQAEVDFWKGRSLALSSAVTALSQQVEALQTPTPGADIPAIEAADG